MFCIHCGKEIGEGSVFCSHCGRKQDASGKKANSKQRKKAIITIIAAVAAAIIVILPAAIFVDYVVNLILYSDNNVPEYSYEPNEYEQITEDSGNNSNNSDNNNSGNNNNNNNNDGNNVNDDDDDDDFEVPEAGDHYNTRTPCTICRNGKCRKCGGDGYVYSSASGKDDRNCTGAYCSRGRCTNCGGDGWRD